MNTLKNIKLIAHRGVSKEAPENSISAFVLAKKEYFYGIEADIHTTKDDKFVVFHDYTLKRMVGTDQFINQLSYEEVKKLKLNAGTNINQYQNESIPDLETYLEVCKMNEVRPFIELKAVNHLNLLDLFIEITQQYILLKDITIISFNKAYLIYLRKKHPDLDIQYLVDDLTDAIINDCILYGFDIDVNYRSLTKEQIDTCHKNNILVNVWTVDDRKLANDLILMGVDFITTNSLK